MNIYEMTDIWDDAGTTFSAISMDVTDTASAADSKLLDLQVGGDSRFSVQKDGRVFFGTDGIMFSENLGRAYFGTKTQPDALVVRPSGGVSVRYGLALTDNVLNPLGGNGVYLDNEALGVLGISIGSNPTELRLYNTYTDASNYERGGMFWRSDVLVIGTEAAGTGIERPVRISGSSVVEIETTNIIKINRSGVNMVSIRSGIVGSESGATLGINNAAWGGLVVRDASAVPQSPPTGGFTLWQANGAGASGDDGDVMLTITDSSGTTKTVTLVDFSAA